MRSVIVEATSVAVSVIAAVMLTICPALATVATSAWAEPGRFLHPNVRPARVALHWQHGGAVSRVDEDATALSHRDPPSLWSPPSPRSPCEVPLVVSRPLPAGDREEVPPGWRKQRSFWILTKPVRASNVRTALMRDHFDPVQPQLQSEEHLLAAEVALELRLLSLSEGLLFCVLLQSRRDPRFEKELKHWLERARECGLNSEDAELLGAAVAALEGEFRELALDVIERARRQLSAMGSRSVSRSGRSRSRLQRGSTLAAVVAAARPATRKMRQWRMYGNRRVRPRQPDSATARLAVAAAAVCLALGISVMEARGDPEMMAARGDPEIRIARRLAASPPHGRCPIPAQLRGAFVLAAKKTDLPLSLLVAVARAESHFDSTARSSAGAIGVLQLMPATARALGVDPADPHANVVAGARYLRSLFNRFGSAQLALAAYNAGPTSVAANAGALPTETKAYVANVRRTWRSLRRCR